MEPHFSIVIPTYNEHDSITPLAEQINAAMEAEDYSYECIWVDDGSTDTSRDRLRNLSLEHSHHRFVLLDGNYGQSAALAIGFQTARGEYVGTLDGDLQNDPTDLPKLMAILKENKVDMVNGRRAKRRDSLIRKISSRIANGVRNWLTSEEVSDVGCSLRVFRRECIQHVPVFKGMHRFLPTLVRLKGYTIMEHPVNHRPRSYGQTKYGISNRLWVGIWDLMAVRWMQSRLVFPKIEQTDGVVQPKENH